MLLGFLSEKTDRVRLHFESCVTHAGEDEVVYLVEAYCRLLDTLDVAYSVLPDLRTIEAEEHGLASILRNEAGLHLFYGPGGVPVPVRLSVFDNGLPSQNAGPAMPPPIVIRVYGGRDTLADLRTGYTNSAAMTPDEHKLLLFGGMIV